MNIWNRVKMQDRKCRMILMRSISCIVRLMGIFSRRRKGRSVYRMNRRTLRRIIRILLRVLMML